ncbi:MAG TPA: hypothetical protein VMF12_07445 [Xanthobacteraceae bacterium]|nr:hypothetical protein [Xanthobacteraceae bacterium]
MNTSTAAHNIRESRKDAREGIREVEAAANAASGDIAKDLQSLREELAHLSGQVREILTSKGTAAWRRAKSSVDDVVSDAKTKGQEAVGSVRETSENVAEAVDESLKRQPYAVLAIVLCLGFLVGATWRR